MAPVDACSPLSALGTDVDTLELGVLVGATVTTCGTKMVVEVATSGKSADVY